MFIYLVHSQYKHKINKKKYFLNFVIITIFNQSITTKPNAMHIKLNHIGSYSGNPAKLIEMTISYFGSSITIDVTDINSRVDEDIIMQLEETLFELKEHNEKMDQSND